MFYAVERCVDGLGDDTWVNCIFKTEEEAQQYIDKIIEAGEADPSLITIVPCEFGKPILQFYN